jgi:hypothetical protein
MKDDGVVALREAECGLCEGESDGDVDDEGRDVEEAEEGDGAVALSLSAQRIIGSVELEAVKPLENTRSSSLSTSLCILPFVSREVGSVPDRQKNESQIA